MLGRWEEVRMECWNEIMIIEWMEGREEENQERNKSRKEGG
jgi:hypothetical protein